MSKKILYLVDGTSLCYRSFFAIKLSTSSGFPSGAVYGFYRTLKKIMSKYNPVYLGICFDISRKTHRQEKFKEYKIHRPPSPDGLKAQMPLIKELVSALSIKMVEKEGYEADDVIASLCKGARKSDLSVVIVSSDKDMYQLMDTDKVSVYNYNKDRLIKRDDFLKENGFNPELMVDYLALAGDSADNIPGAKGIGKVSATNLIKEFGAIKNIFNSLDKLAPKLKEIIEKNKENIILSRDLAELYPCELDLGWPDLKIGEPDSNQIYELFSRLEFKALLNALPAPALNSGVKIKEGAPKELLRELTREELIFFIDKESVFIFDHSKKCIYKTSLKDAKEILEAQEIRKISYDLKSQLPFLKNIKLKGDLFDVKIAAYLLDSSLGDYSLEGLISNYLAEYLKDLPSENYPYFIERLYRLLSVKLKEEGLSKLFSDVEIPLISVLNRMQAQGVRVDAEILCVLLKKVDKTLESLEKEVFKIAGREFNLNSPKQLGGILFDELGIRPLKRTKTGYSTNEEVLDKLSSQYPIAAHVLEYRHLNKLKTTYITPLIEQVRISKGVLHTQFNQAVAQTGRLSSSSPNLQSIPAKGEFSQALRKAFVSSFKGGYIFSGDYSQIELRILAHLSGDNSLIQSFSQDLDIHAATASLLFGVKEDKIDDSQRNIAKRVNFGIIYGMSSYGLSKELRVTAIEAQNFIDDYFKKHKQIEEYMQREIREAQKCGYVKTILGRRRRIPDINNSNIQLKEFAGRQAINAPIQGSCADLIKVAMVRIFDELNKRKLKTKLIIQIHDELIFDVPKDELNEVKVLVKEYMEQALKLIVPVKVNLKAGRNWGEMKEIK